jgi:hypothetical protein
VYAKAAITGEHIERLQGVLHTPCALRSAPTNVITEKKKKKKKYAIS